MLKALFPQIAIPLAAAKAFFSTIKGGFWLVFIILFLFIGFGGSCHHKKEDPIVEVVKTPEVIPDIQKQHFEDTNKAIVDDQNNRKVTETKVKDIKKKSEVKVKKILSDTTLTPEQTLFQIGDVQISSIEQTYSEFYGSPSSSSGS